jgi:hypothetical protein
VRELSRGGRRKNDVIDAAAAASVAALWGDANPVLAEDATTVLVLLDERRDNVITQRTRLVNQLAGPIPFTLVSRTWCCTLPPSPRSGCGAASAAPAMSSSLIVAVFTVDWKVRRNQITGRSGGRSCCAGTRLGPGVDFICSR